MSERFILYIAGYLDYRSMVYTSCCLFYHGCMGIPDCWCNSIPYRMDSWNWRLAWMVVMGDKGGRWVITDNSPLMHKIGYSKIIMIPIEEDYDLSNSYLENAISENAIKLHGKPVDIRTSHISLNSVNLNVQFVAINTKVVTAGQLNAQKNEIMRGWRLKEPKYKKPWWRFW